LTILKLYNREKEHCRYGKRDVRTEIGRDEDIKKSEGKRRDTDVMTSEIKRSERQTKRLKPRET